MDSQKETLIIVGTGNVAYHLEKAFSPYFEVKCINPHTLEGLPDFSDLIIISIKDSVIGEVADKLRSKCRLVAHTSGSVPMDILKEVAKNYGVFYPLQTFTKSVALDYAEIPFFVEGNTPETTAELTALGRMLSEKIYEADSEKRKKLHLASVFACNFTNRLMGIAQEILSEADIDFRVVLPLLRQTLDKLTHLSPTEAQTGPAVRKDYRIIEAHLKMLENNPELQELYRNMSSQIINKSEIKG